MRIPMQGLYLQYRDVATPTEVFDRIAYAFTKASDRTCLVTNPVHVQLLLGTGNYRAVAAEIDPAVLAALLPAPTPAPEKPKGKKAHA